MEKKYKLIALFGKSGVGKDTLCKYLSDKHGFHKVVGCTTRPKREGEVDRKDYFFLSEKSFTKKLLTYELVEATSFKDWFYGTSIKSFQINSINIGIFNPESIIQLRQDNRFDIIPIEIVVKDKHRLIRTLMREEDPDCSEICRRFLADEKDFDELEFPYYQYNNEKPILLNDICSIGQIPEWMGNNK